MNRKNSGAETNVLQICLDIAVLAGAFAVEYFIFFNKISKTEALYCLTMVEAFAVIYILSNKEARIYNVTLFFYLDRFYRIITKSWGLAAVTTAMVLFVFNPGKNIRRFYFVFLMISYFLLSINIIFSRLLQFVKCSAQAPRAAFVGGFDEYKKFTYFLNKTSIRLNEIGYILRAGEEANGMYNVLGYLESLEEIIRTHEIDQIYFIQRNHESISEIQQYIDICMEMGVTVKVVIDSSARRRLSSYVSSVGTYPVVTYHTITLNNYEQFLKRVMDIVVSILGIIAACPVLLVTAAAIKLDSPGPVIFKQVRVGKNGRHFHMYKFRSMYTDAEEKKRDLLEQNEMTGGVMFKIKDDPRITRVGKFIRKTSIDELPQLFNVLQGRMSLVGTRPPTLDEVGKYRRSQWRRISIKPGITGMWQVSGRNDITDFEQVVELDLKYIDNWSLLLDLKILFCTVHVLFERKGAY